MKLTQEQLKTIAFQMYRAALNNVDWEVEHSECGEVVSSYGTDEVSFDVDDLNVWVIYDWEFDYHTERSGEEYYYRKYVEVDEVRATIREISIYFDCDEQTISDADVEQINAYAA